MKHNDKIETILSLRLSKKSTCERLAELESKIFLEQGILDEKYAHNHLDTTDYFLAQKELYEGLQPNEYLSKIKKAKTIKRTENHHTFLAFLFLLVIISSTIYSIQSPTGLVTLRQTETRTQLINETYYGNGTIAFNVTNITSLQITGNFDAEQISIIAVGNREYTIYESGINNRNKRTKTPNLITGNVILDNSSNNSSNESNTITEKKDKELELAETNIGYNETINNSYAIENVTLNITNSTINISNNINISDSTNITINTTNSLNDSNTNQTNNTNSTINLTTNTTDYYNETNQTEINYTTINETEFNVTDSNITNNETEPINLTGIDEPRINETNNETNTTILIPERIQFIDVCKETCIISEDIQYIKIISDGEVYVESIKYSIPKTLGIKQITEVPNFNGTINETITINGNEYFTGAIAIEITSNEGYDYNTSNNTIYLTPKQQGIISAKLQATNGIDFLESNNFYLIIGNITNETNTTNLTVTQEPAVIGEPVKWTVRGPAKEIEKYVIPKTARITDKKTTQTTNDNSIENFFEEIIYETPAPQEKLSKKNEHSYLQEISAQENVTNVTSYVDVPEGITENGVKIFWLEEKKFLTNYWLTDKNDDGKNDRINYLVPHLSNQSFEINITILNVQSYPLVGNNWTVKFNTTGIANLSIIGEFGTTFGNDLPDDLTSLSLLCGNVSINTTQINNGIFVKDYSCNSQTSLHTSKVHTSGKHVQKYQFGDLIAYANNTANAAIVFEYPTPDNGTVQQENYIFVNTTITDSENTSAFIDFNGSVIGYWSFDYYDGSNIYENSTNALTTTYSTDASIADIVTGKFGDAFNFTNGELISVSDSSVLSMNSSGNYTWHYWINPNDLTQEWQTVLDIYSGSDTFVSLYIANNTDGTWGPVRHGVLAAWTSTASDRLIQESEENVLTQGEWNHVLVTYQGNLAQAYRFNIFVNGVNVTKRGDATSTGTISNINPTTIRMGNNEFNEDLDAAVDELTIHNRILSKEEINASYYNKLYRLYNNFTGLNDGNYTFTVHAIDTNGNLNRSSRKVIIGNNGNTMITWEYPTPENNTMISSGSITLNTTITDDNYTSAYFDWNYSILTYLSFENYNTANVSDESSYLLNASYGGGVDDNNITTSIYGNGINLDGIDDHLIIEGVKNTNELTLSAWVKSSDEGYIISRKPQQIEIYDNFDTGSFSDNWIDSEGEGLWDFYNNKLRHTDTSATPWQMAQHKQNLSSVDGWAIVTQNFTGEAAGATGFFIRIPSSYGYRYSVAGSQYGDDTEWATWDGPLSSDWVDDTYLGGYDWAKEDTIAITWQGAGDNTIISIWINPTKQYPYDKNNWDSKTDTADYILTDNPVSNLDADTGLGIGLVSEVGANQNNQYDNFVAGTFPVTADYSGFGLSTINGGQFKLMIEGTEYLVNSVTNINDNAWHHIVGTYDLETMRLYVDGVLEGTNTAPSGWVDDELYNITIGAEEPIFNNFDGIIDEITIHDRAISAQEVNASFNNSQYRLFTTISSLSNGIYDYSAYAIDSSGNINKSDIRTLTIGNNPPSINSISLYSVDGSNSSYKNITCSATLLDQDNDTLNVSVKWYKNDVLFSTVQYNNDYINGTLFNASQDSSNLGYDEYWICSLSISDGITTLSYINSSNIYLYEDITKPIINWVLPTPDDSFISTNNQIVLNTTITDTSNTSAFFDWNKSVLAYYNFEYTNDTNLFDNSSYDRTAQFLGDLSNQNITNAKFGHGINFDGINDYIIANITNSSSITLSAWVKTSNEGYIISKKPPQIEIYDNFNSGSFTDNWIDREGAGNWDYNTGTLRQTDTGTTGWELAQNKQNLSSVDGWAIVTMNYSNNVGKTQGISFRIPETYGYRYVLAAQDYQTETAWNTWDGPTSAVGDYSCGTTLQVLAWSSGDIMAATWQGTGTSTIIKFWKNPTKKYPYDKNNWDNSTDAADYTFTTNPCSGRNADSGLGIGLVSERDADEINRFEDFYAGTFATELVMPYSLSTINGGEFSITVNDIIHTVNSTTNINDNEWHHIVGTYDQETMRLYVDGVLEGTNTAPSGPLNTSSSSLIIGALEPKYGFFSGELDEILIHSRSINETEVLALYNNSQYQLSALINLGNDGEYNYSAHAIDSYGNYLITSERQYIKGDPCDFINGDYVFSEDITCNNKIISADSLTIPQGTNTVFENVTLVVGATNIAGNLIVKNSKNTIWQNDWLNITGNFTLQNSSLKLNVTYNNEFGIAVKSGGLLIVVNETNITNGYNSSAYYAFQVLTGGKLIMNHSEADHIGYTGLTQNNGLYIQSNYNLIQNSVLDGGFRVLYLVGDYNNISNVTIINSPTFNYRLWIASGAEYNRIDNLYLPPAVGSGAYINSLNNNFSNIRDLDSFYIVANSDNNYFYNSSFEHTSSGDGLAILQDATHSADNNYFLKGNASSAWGYALKLWDGTNNTFQDFLISGGGAGGDYDVVMDQDAGTYYFINTTFVRDTYLINTGTMIVQQYVTIRVLDQFGIPVSGAIINLYDTTGKNSNTATTDSDGYVVKLNVTMFNRTSSGVVYASNYTLNVNKTGFETYISEFNLTDNMNFSVSINSPPTVNLLSPISGTSTSNTTITYQCVAYDTNPVINVSLYTNNTGGWQINKSWDTRTFSEDDNTIFLARFNGNLLSEEGESPTTSTGISYESGRYYQSVFLDTGDSLQYYTNQNLELTQGTIQMWIYPTIDMDTTSTYYALFAAYNSSGNSLEWYIDDSTGTTEIVWSNSQATAPLKTGTNATSWNANQWYHLAVTFDFNSDEYRMYRDGVLVGVANTPLSEPLNATFMHIGEYWDGGIDLQGRIAEIKISDKVLSGEEINYSINTSKINVTANFTIFNHKKGNYEWTCEASDDQNSRGVATANNTLQITATCFPDSVWLIDTALSCANSNIIVDELNITNTGSLVLTGVNLTVNNRSDIYGNFTFTDSPNSLWQNGNLTVEGVLNLVNSKIHMNASYDNHIGINVSGTFSMNESSNITNGINLSANYFFIINNGANSNFVDSHISYAGSEGDTNEFGGLYVDTPSIITNMNFVNHIGITLGNNAGFTNITNSTFIGGTSHMYGINSSASNIILSDLNISNFYSLTESTTGIRITEGDNIIIDHVNITNITSSATTGIAAGINIISSNNIIINNSNIDYFGSYGAVGNGLGLYLGVVSNSKIFNSNISNMIGEGIAGSYGIFVGSDNNTFRNIKLENINLTNEVIGISIDSDANNNNLSNINLSGSNNLYVLGQNNNFDQLYINHSTDMEGVLFGSTADNNMLKNSDIYTISTSGGYAIYSVLSANLRKNYVYNTTAIASGMSSDLAINSVGFLNLTNVTFNGIFSATGNATAYSNWYFDITVLTQISEPISDATINFIDVHGNNRYSASTDSNGLLLDLEISEFIYNRTFQDNLNNYTLKINKTGFDNYSQSFNITTNFDETITLAEATNTCYPSPKASWKINQSITCSDITITAYKWNVTSTGSLTLNNVNVIIINKSLINGNVSIEDSKSTIWLNDDLVINGNYFLTNSTLRLNGSNDGAVRVNITPSGYFQANESSNITNGVLKSANYEFIANGRVNFTNTNVSFAGYSPEVITSGVYINSSSYFNGGVYSNYVGIILGSNASGTQIHNILFDGKYGSASGIESYSNNNINISNSNFTNIENASGFSQFGLYLFETDYSNISNIYIYDNTPLQGADDFSALWIEDTTNAIISRIVLENNNPAYLKAITIDASSNIQLNNYELISSSSNIDSGFNYGLQVANSNNNNFTNLSFNNYPGYAITHSSSSNNIYKDISIEDGRSERSFFIDGFGNYIRLQNINMTNTSTMEFRFDNQAIIDNLRITNSTGLNISSTTEVQISNFFINDTEYIFINEDGNHTLVNGIIDNSSGFDFSFANPACDNTDLNLYNVSYDRYNVDFTTGSCRILNTHYARVYVNNTNGIPVINSDVHAYNNNSLKIFDDTTDSFGYTGWFNATDFIQNATTKTYHNYHLLNTTTPTQGNASTYQNISQTNTYSITVESNDPPRFGWNISLANGQEMGYITYDIININYGSSVTASELRAGRDRALLAQLIYRTFMDFNTTNIDPNASITKVDLGLARLSPIGYPINIVDRSWNWGDYSSNLSAYTDLEGTAYNTGVTTWVSTSVDQYAYTTIGGAVRTHLENYLNEGYFILGLRGQTEATSTNNRFYSETAAFAKVPRLNISYQVKNFSWEQSTNLSPINLDLYFYDSDDQNSLTYTLNGNTNFTMYVNATNKRAIFVPNATFVGLNTVSITATDNFGASTTSNNFYLKTYAVPVLENLTKSTNVAGYGFNITLGVNATALDGIDTVLLEVTPPSGTPTNYSTTNDTQGYFYANFTTYTNGTYTYRFHANSISNGNATSSSGTFDININATVQVKTLKDIYYDNEVVNLTDPPSFDIISNNSNNTINHITDFAISNAYVYPTDVRPDDYQYQYASVTSPSGIKNAYTIINHDLGFDLVPLNLVSGSVYDGNWSNRWLVHDTVEKEYNTSFVFIDNEDNHISKEVLWTDPTTFWCYQETANISTACGGLSTGTYAQNIFLNNAAFLEAIDGSYSTDGWVATTGYFWINYSKPANTQYGSRWQFKEIQGMLRNVTVQNNCLDQSPLQLRVDVVDADNGDYNLQCWNGATWSTLLAGFADFLYEEGMYWNISQSLTYTEFEGIGDTSDLSLVESDTNITHLVLDDASNAKINFSINTTLNYSMNLDTAVEIAPNYVFVNSTLYPVLNKSANITIYGQYYDLDIFKDGNLCTDCYVLNSDPDNNQITFNVSSFSNYTWAEANQSKINNTGSTDFYGYVYMAVRFYNTTQAQWVLDDVVITSNGPNLINSNDLLKLDALFNGNWDTSMASYGSGLYQVYVEIRSPTNTLLQDSNGNSLIASANFTYDKSDTPTIDSISLSPINGTATQDLYLNITCSDLDLGNTITVFYEIYENGINQTSLAGNQIVTNGVLTNVKIIDATNLTKNEVWSARAYCSDGGLQSNWLWTQENSTIKNTVPSIPTLIYPLNSSRIDNQNPLFNWTDSLDVDFDDGIDTITYDLNLSNANASCYTTINTSITDSNWTAPESLCLDLEGGNNYTWSVRAYDGTNYSSWSQEFNFSIPATPPNTTNVSSTPAILGYGYSVNVTANITHPRGIDTVFLELTEPSQSPINYTMYDSENTGYWINFTFWNNGTYNYRIIANSTDGLYNITSGAFVYAIEAVAQIKTIKDIFSLKEIVNLTDPPGIDPPNISTVLVDPYKVRPGDILKINSVVNDNNLIAVKVDIKHENGIDSLNMNQIAENEYSVNWIVHDTLEKEYWVEVIAIDADNNVVKKKAYYYDPITFWCLQESANAAPTCGGIGNGTYSCSAGWSVGNPCSLSYDGNYGTFGYDQNGGGTSYVYVNYTKPNNANLGSRIQHKGDSTYNTTIPTNCFNQNPIRLRFQSTNIADYTTDILSCFAGGTTWTTVNTWFDTGFYEEAIYWNLSNLISYSEFSGIGDTTNLDELNDGDNITNLVLDDAVDAKIVWSDNITLNSSMNLDTAVEIAPSYIFVNSTLYPVLNKSANITIYGQYSNLLIFKNGNLCTDCYVLNSDPDNNQITFNVSSFSNYTWAEANQSKINNTGSTNFYGFIYLAVEFYNNSNGQWILDDIVYSDLTPQIIQSNNLVKLDALFNNKWNTTQNASYGSGTYRVKVEVRDNTSAVMITNSGIYLNDTYSFTFQNNTVATVQYINLTEQNSLTTDDLKLNVTCTDANIGDSLTTYYEFYKNGVNQTSIAGNSAISNNVNTLITTIDNSLTAKNEEWSARARCYDGTESSDWVWVATNITIQNTVPSTPVNSRPLNDTYIYDKKPLFNWTSSIDQDVIDGIDSLTYEINLTNPSGTCYTTYTTALGTNSFTPSSNLCVNDNFNKNYTWQVRAYDGDEYSSWSEPFNFSIFSVVDIRLIDNSSDLGNVERTNTTNTVDTNDPMEIRNDGNVLVNLSIVANIGLWNSVPLNTTYFRYNASDNETNSFNHTLTPSGWKNITNNQTLLVARFNWENVSDQLFIHFEATAPLDEPPGEKTSSLNITAVYTDD